MLSLHHQVKGVYRMDTYIMRNWMTNEIFEGTLRSLWRIAQHLYRHGRRYNHPVCLTIYHPWTAFRVYLWRQGEIIQKCIVYERG